jgi:hypothetical protein
MQQSYVYKWTHSPTLMWYVGSRTSKKSHINDGYLCSSKTVKPLIQKNPQEWHREIICVGTPKEMRLLETEILSTVDARNDGRSFNQHNQDMMFVCTGHTKETIEKIKKGHLWAGKKRPEQSKALLGKKRKPEHIKKFADAMRGIPKTKEHIAKLKKVKSQGVYITPCGEFQSSRDAAEANKCVKSSVLQRCFGYTTRGKWYPPVQGWSFVPKEIA